MSVCTHICVYAQVWVCIYKHMCMCIHVMCGVYMCVSVREYMCCAHVLLCTHVYGMCVCAHCVRMCICMLPHSIHGCHLGPAAPWHPQSHLCWGTCSGLATPSKGTSEAAAGRQRLLCSPVDGSVLLCGPPGSALLSPSPPLAAEPLT